jgi:hypothetical protein
MATGKREKLFPYKINWTYYRMLTNTCEFYVLRKRTWITSIICEYNSDKLSFHLKIKSVTEIPDYSPRSKFTAYSAQNLSVFDKGHQLAS